MTYIPIKNTLSKFILYYLIFFNNNICGNTTPVTTTNYELFSTSYTLDTIKKLKLKKTCQSLLDCSEGALECRKDNNKNNSYCLYPDYICINTENCYLVGKKENYEHQDSILYPNTNNNNNNDNDNSNNNDNKNQKYIINPCSNNTTNIVYKIDSNTNTNNNNNSITSIEISKDDSCTSNTCMKREIQTDDINNNNKNNTESSLLYCNNNNNNNNNDNNDNDNDSYECQQLIEENDCNTVSLISDKSKSESQATSLTHDLKYVFISIITILTMGLLIIVIGIYNKKSKRLEESDLEKYTVAIV